MRCSVRILRQARRDALSCLLSKNERAGTPIDANPHPPDPAPMPSVGPEPSPQPLFLAVFLYEARSTATNFRPVYQECFTLLRAASEEEAAVRAEVHGRAHAHSYSTESGDVITWSLHRVVEVVSLLDGELDDGADLHARFFQDLGAYDAFLASRRGEGSDA